MSARPESDFSCEAASWPVKNGCVGFRGAVHGSVAAFELMFWLSSGAERIALILSPRSLRVFFRLPYLMMTIPLFCSSSLTFDRGGLPRRGPALDGWTLGDVNFPSDRTFSIFLGGVRVASSFGADGEALWIGREPCSPNTVVPCPGSPSFASTTSAGGAFGS